jgi:hypothetical protein
LFFLFFFFFFFFFFTGGSDYDSDWLSSVEGRNKLGLILFLGSGFALSFFWC